MMRAPATFAGALALLAACHRPTTDAPEAGAGPAPVADGQAPDGSALAAPRCTASREVFSVGDPSGGGEVEVGDAVPFDAGTAVGVVRRVGAARRAAVAVVDAAVAGVRSIDLGATLGDAPPPGIAVSDGRVLAAAYALPAADAGAAARGLTLYAIDPAAASSQAVGFVPQHRDDSLAFDIAGGAGSALVVWDEAVAGDGAVPRGVIRGAVLVAKGPTYSVGATTDLSPPPSDAELPRVLASDRGFDALWIARAPEPEDATTDAAVAAEATGEPRTFAWVEWVPLDRQAKPIGPAKRLTSATGHVSAFDALADARGGAPSLLVVARDDGEAVDGSGGALLRVRVSGDRVEAPLAYPCDGLGRGAPELVDAPAGPWLAWVGPHEQLRLLPLDAAGLPVAQPSHEEAMDEARPLALLAGGPRVLVATPTDAAAQLRVLACAR